MRKKFVIKETNERIIPASGLAVVGAMLGNVHSDSHCERRNSPRKPLNKARS